MNEQVYVLATLIFLVFTYVMYTQRVLNKHQFLVLRLVYYGYWYWLLYADVSKYIIGCYFNDEESVAIATHKGANSVSSSSNSFTD